MIQEYRQRREKLMSNIGVGNIGIMTAAQELIRNGDAHYRYRQNSDFYYLTGFREPEAVLVMIPGRTDGETILFVRERDPQMEIWNGPRAGIEGACKEFGANQAYPITELDTRLPELLQDKKQVHYALGRDVAFENRLRGWLEAVRKKVRQGVNAPDDFVNIEHHLHEMRLFKSPKEIELMRTAAEISAKAHHLAMREVKEGMYEYQLAALIEYEFKRNGCAANAYETIVGGGANACVLHYVENNAPLKQGDLVLVDAGGELDYYAADITRTFPVGGKFSEKQAAIYDLVLTAQAEALKVVKPGNLWNAPQEAIIRVSAKGLLELGLLTGTVEQIIKDQTYRRFYMHNSGHWLGLDVHDVGAYKTQGQWRTFAPGMVITVEPGLYIAASDDIDAAWWNIGVRIEDDVLVTESGYDILSKGVPKSIAEIEGLQREN